MYQPVLKPISQMSTSERFQQFGFCKQLFDSDVSSSNSAIKKGRRLYEYAKGNVFNDSELEAIRKKDEVPIQAQDMVSKLASIFGSVKNTWKQGYVVGSGSEDAAPAELRQQIMQNKIWPESNIDNVKMQVAMDMLITAYPGTAWIEPFDRCDVTKQGMSVYYCPWDSVIYDAGSIDPMMLDLRRVSRIKQMTYEDIVQMYSDRTGIENVEMLKALAQQAIKITSNDGKDSDFSQARTGSITSNAGFINVIETLFFTYIDIDVAVDVYGNEEPLPLFNESFNPDEYIKENPGTTIKRSKHKVLWSTTWTQNGLILDNGTHWLQCGMYPCVPLLAPMMNKERVSLVQFAVDTLKEISYIRTERLQGLRTAINNLAKVRKGAVSDMQKFEAQRRMSGGTIEIEDDHPMSDVEFVENKYPSTAFENSLNQSKDDLSMITVERNFEGGQQASQESSKAIGARISQGLNKLSFFFGGQDYFDKTLCRLIIKAMPFCLTDEFVLRIFDPNNGIKNVNVNEPTDFDWAGQAIAFKNNLSFDDFDFIYTSQDNSISAQETARQVFLDFLKNYGAGNIPADFLPVIASKYPSTEVQAFGNALMEKQKQQENQPPPAPKASISITAKAEDLGQSGLMSVARTAGIDLPQAQPQQSQQQQPQQPQLNQMENVNVS